MFDGFIKDVFKDNDGAWDTVRLIAGPACAIATVIILKNMALDAKLFDHVQGYAIGLGGTWASYAGSVVGHAWAKK